MSLPVIPADKANHIVYGAALFAVGYTFSVLAGHASHALQAGAALTLVFAVGKEAADWWRNRQARAAGLLPPHGVEPLDAVATCVGGALAALPVLAPHLTFKGAPL